MVVKADGTKWACLSCLKGHRVSGCTHTDRDLILVPKKGRPVTQCQHCRQERKKRSAHVKCDCGEVDKPHHSKEKCIHLREAEERAKAGFHEDHPPKEDPNHLAAVAEEQGCCCHHGGKCTCSMVKKEARDSDDDGLAPHGPAVKPRLDSRGSSEGHLTVFQNGHHKPVHRKNHAAHECGMPYKMPMPRTQSQQDIPSAARRSVDNLSLDQHAQQRSRGPERRVSKSEQHSPRLSPNDSDYKMSGYDFNTLTQVRTNQSQQSMVSDTYSFPAFEPMSASADGTHDPWSSIPNNNPFGVWPTHDGTGIGQPALTATSSGTQSEIDEIPPLDDMYSFGMPSIQEDPSTFNFNSVPSGDSPQSNRRSLPPNFFSQTELMALNGQWENSMDIRNNEQLKPKPSDATPSSAFADMWSSSMAASPSIPSRALGGLPLNGRPASHSVGPGSAPNDELMQQLFPGIDVDTNFFSTDSPQDTGTTKSYHVEVTSAPMSYSALEGDAMFTSQPWADGSLSVPNDPFNAPYDLDEEFSNPHFTNGWTQ